MLGAMLGARAAADAGTDNDGHISLSARLPAAGAPAMLGAMDALRRGWRRGWAAHSSVHGRRRRRRQRRTWPARWRAAHRAAAAAEALLRVRGRLQAAAAAAADPPRPDFSAGALAALLALRGSALRRTLSERALGQYCCRCRRRRWRWRRALWRQQSGGESRAVGLLVRWWRERRHGRSWSVLAVVISGVRVGRHGWLRHGGRGSRLR